MDVVRKAGFIAAYTFLYSKRTGTPAASMPDQVDEATAGERFKRLLAVVGEVGAAQAEAMTGQTVEVLCEEYKASEGTMTGRLDNNLLVHFPADESLLGELVSVKLTTCKGFYYLGERA